MNYKQEFSGVIAAHELGINQRIQKAMQPLEEENRKLREEVRKLREELRLLHEHASATVQELLAENAESWFTWATNAYKSVKDRPQVIGIIGAAFKGLTDSQWDKVLQGDVPVTIEGNTLVITFDYKYGQKVA